MTQAKDAKDVGQSASQNPTADPAAHSAAHSADNPAHSVHRRSDGGVWPDGTPRDPASGPPHYGEDSRDKHKPRDHGSDWATSDLVKDEAKDDPAAAGPASRHSGK